MACNRDVHAPFPRAERDLAISFTWAKPDPEISSTGGGLFANVIPAGGETTSTAPAGLPTPEPAKPAATGAPARQHRMED